ncbi:unnamed protein product [Tilletia caries]|nr:unnamed protein product [Tilletia caries]
MRVWRWGQEVWAQGNAFEVEVYIWSAGAVLYSLAIDQPPFAGARSTLDILNRKRNFFQTEEADRPSRFDVEVGMSAISSRPASRTSVGGGGGGMRSKSYKGPPKKPGRRAKGLSEQALCYDVDGTRVSRNKKRWVVSYAAAMAESSERALLIDPRALARAAQTVQTALGHSSAPNSYSNPAFRESDHHIYDPGPDLFEDELDSDYGSDEEHAPYEHPQSSIVAIPLLPYIGRSRTVNPSRSRFHSWHIKVAAIFDIAYGLEPAPIALPGTISLDCSCPPSANSRRPRTIKVYDVGSPFVTVGLCCHNHIVENIVRAGLFPASPSNPQVAFTMTLLRWFQTLVDQAGMGAHNMAMTIESFLRRGTTFRQSRTQFEATDTLRKQLRNALTWLTVIERYAEQMSLQFRPSWTEQRPGLAEDHLILTLNNLADSCPACFQPFKHGVPKVPGSLDGPQIIIAIDGNFTQKRRRRDDSVCKQPFPPRRFLSQRQVAKAETDWRAASGSNPDQESCIANIRAIDCHATASHNSPFEVTGLMGACCRHDIPLVMCDMLTPGERHYYATALIKAIIDAVGPNLTHLGVAYDIGCRFDPSTKVASLFRTDTVKISWAVPVFHVYGHTYSCQLRYSPRHLPGYGFTDGEGMERVWSALSNLINTTRNMAQGERRFSLEERCQYIASQRRLDLFKHLKSKETRLRIVAAAARAVLSSAFDQDCVAAQYRIDASVGSSPSDPCPSPANGSALRSISPLQSGPDASQPRVASSPVSRRPKYLLSAGPPRVTSIDSVSDWNPPSEFHGIDEEVLLVVRQMSIDRRSVTQLNATNRRRKKPAPLDAVPTYCRDLLRMLAEIRLVQSCMYDRPAAAAAHKVMHKINLALKEEHPDDCDEPPSQLEWSSLFDDDTFQTIEDWAEDDRPSRGHAAWWANPATAKAINAFEELCRIAEERHRIDFERSAAGTWIKERIEHLHDVASEHVVYQDALTDAQYLIKHWDGIGDYASLLLPRGCFLPQHEGDYDEPSEDDEDPELDAQLRRLAMDDDDQDPNGLED